MDGGRMVQYLVVQNPNIEVLGRVLYTDYYYLFIIASFILLVAMIGAIVLTHDTGIEIQDRKVQDIFVHTLDTTLCSHSLNPVILQNTLPCPCAVLSSLTEGDY